MIKENDDTFSTLKIYGTWWIPGKKKLKKRGVLFFDPKEGLRLETHGFLWLKKKTGITNTFQHPEIILGVSDDGEALTLLNNISTKSNMSFCGEGWAVISSSYLIKNCHVKTRNDLKFKTVKFRSTHIESWFSSPLFKTNRPKNKKVKITYSFPKDFKFKASKIGAMLHSHTFLNTDDLSVVASKQFNSKTYFKITSDNYESFEWFLEKLYDFVGLIQLFIGEDLFVYDLEFESFDDATPKDDRFYKTHKTFFRPESESKPKDLHPRVSLAV
jgi:hypothetical protein